MNPDLFLFSSPWSPPGWMKFNNSMLGGSMRNHYLGVYAQYFLKFLQGYAAEGVPIQAVTSQNEVDTDQDGRMPACSWPQEYEIHFVSSHLGPLLESSGMPTKIWILDHNYNLWGRVVCSLEDEKLRRYCNSVAWHGYVGTPDMMSKVQDAYPEVQMHWTEGGPDYTDPALSERLVQVGRRLSRISCAIGAAPSPHGTWRSTNTASPISGRFPAAAWSPSIHRRKKSPRAANTGRSPTTRV